MLGKWLRRLILKKEGKRNPLGDPPLRLPGQWVREELDRALTDFALAVVLPLVVPIFWGCFQLTSALAGDGWPSGRATLFGALGWLAIVALFWRSAWQKRSQIRNLRLGMLAEQIVGQQLERCRTAGYYVFHDIPCQGRTTPFNIDHLVIGPGGIFVVETKARSKPDKGQTIAWLEGNAVRFSDGSYNASAIAQAEAIAGHVIALLKPLIRESRILCDAFTPNRPLPVQPVLVYPGWYTERRKGEWHNVLLTNTDGVVGFVRKSKPRLSDQEAKRIALILGKHLQQERRGLLDH